MERSYCFRAGKEDPAFVKEHLFKMTFSLYFSLKCGTGMENHAEMLYLLSLKNFSFDLVFGYDRAPVHMNVSKVVFMLH